MKIIFAKKKTNALNERCWDGYVRNYDVPKGEPGSCQKKGSVKEEENNLDFMIRKTLSDEGGAAGMEALIKGTKASAEEIRNAIKGMNDVGIHKDGDYIMDDGDNIDVVDEGKICDAGIEYVLRTDPGGKDIHRGDEDTDGDGENEIKNWSARAAQIASLKCKNPSYGTGKSKKDESIEEAEGGLKAWEKENWVHSDGTPCGGGDKDGSKSRCKPKSKWKTMTAAEKKADDAKKKAGTKAGKQYVPATKKGKVTKAHTKREGKITQSLIDQIIKEEIAGMIVEEYLMIDASYDDGSPLSEDFGFYENLDEQELEEAVYQGRTVKLNKPTRGDVKKFKVFVNSGKKDKKGRIVAKKVNFGDKKMRIKKSNPKRRASFRARHNCANPGPKTMPRYWSCKKW